MGVLGPGELLGPRRGILKGKTAQDATDTLIGPFGLTIGLGMEPGRKTGGGPDLTAEFPPKLRGELGTPVRNNIRGKTMEFKNVIDHNLSSLLSGGEFWKRDEVRGFGKAIDDCKDNG